MPHPNGALTGLHEIAENYDIILCDIWGVLHNGVKRYPEADNALRKFKKFSKRSGPLVALVTNMPRPINAVVQMLDDLGIKGDAYDAVSSSGDVSRTQIAAYQGQTVQHVGPQRFENLFEGIDVTLGSAEDAAAIIVSDVDSEIFARGAYDAMIALWLKRDLPMICANPDKIVEVGGKMKYCAGALADLYQERGGQVLMAGKPYAPVYDLALEKLEAGSISPKRILAIGDAVRTDAKGAALNGFDFLFITGSVHAKDLEHSGGASGHLVSEMLAPTGVTLAGHMEQLHW